ncbi:hypothetical protein GCM10011581_00430 [Saccharopolyspora subtropica]|uniref:D-alanyl-D-alanine carboxypeptidase/D-alanyl-D-alanine-endopeptidase (Penicillin-binding protein 4) n=1 Tax=Saccharopolyspora thermophila TaxID=89367 RepID=A0A917JJD9_9PSEU|nr:D-alanyl-D-alanine carboxypeptidase/D-alanyl-D-alanine-endopeptidase [Saccharopolyspora subtropica]GGI67504.1 hypothetical protein GCM10011581_00430 [Saccharopolyspora subtropica]
MPEPQECGGEVAGTDVRPTGPAASSPHGSPPDRPEKDQAPETSETTPPEAAPNQPESATAASAEKPEQTGEADQSAADETNTTGITAQPRAAAANQRIAGSLDDGTGSDAPSTTAAQSSTEDAAESAPEGAGSAAQQGDGQPESDEGAAAEETARPGTAAEPADQRAEAARPSGPDDPTQQQAESAPPAEPEAESARDTAGQAAEAAQPEQAGPEQPGDSRPGAAKAEDVPESAEDAADQQAAEAEPTGDAGQPDASEAAQEAAGRQVAETASPEASKAGTTAAEQQVADEARGAEPAAGEQESDSRAGEAESGQQGCEPSKQVAETTPIEASAVGASPASQQAAEAESERPPADQQADDTAPSASEGEPERPGQQDPGAPAPRSEQTPTGEQAATGVQTQPSAAGRTESAPAGAPDAESEQDAKQQVTETASVDGDAEPAAADDSANKPVAGSVDAQTSADDQTASDPGREAGADGAAGTDDHPTDEPERVAESGPATQVIPRVTGDDGPSAAEQTQLLTPIAVDPEPQRADQPQQMPGVEATQKFTAVRAPSDATQQISRAPAETESERTTRIDLSALRAAPESAPEQTQQFARPNFDVPPQRPATAADFAGLTAPAPPTNVGGMVPPQARPAAPEDFAGLAAPRAERPVAAPEDFAGLTASRAQPQRVGPTVPPQGFDGPSGVRAQPQRVSSEASGAEPRRRRALIAVAVVVVVLLGLGVGFGPMLVEALRQMQIASPPAPVRLTPSIKPLDQNAPVPTESGLRAALAGPLADPGLGTLAGSVIDAQTGRVLWQQNPGLALTPASTGKLLTVSAALLVLGPQARLTTKVVRGSQPGSVVLIGGGDFTLSSLPVGSESVYPGAAHLDELVAQVRAATGGNVTSVQFDISRYTGPKLAPGWLPQDVPAGMMSPVESLMLDGGRANPTVDYSPRTSTPALDAAQEFARRLGGSIPVSEGTAPPGAQVLGQVQSPTVQEMSDMLLLHSDNMLAEALAREVAIATGNEPSFAGGVKAVRDVLTQHGFNLAGTTMADASGLSLNDRTTPSLLAALLAAATTPASPEGTLAPRSARLRGLLPGLPIAGGTGSLDDRYLNSAGRGWVRAKTGTLDGANSLAGTVVTEDGRLLVFALMSNGTSPVVARPALDKIVDTLRGCGCR